MLGEDDEVKEILAGTASVRHRAMLLIAGAMNFEGTLPGSDRAGQGGVYEHTLKTISSERLEALGSYRWVFFAGGALRSDVPPVLSTPSWAPSPATARCGFEASSYCAPPGVRGQW